MAEATAKLALAVGDRVVYPNQGVCRVTGIEGKEVAGQKLTFVTMVREEDGARVMVPEAKVTAIGLRKVATSAEVEGIFDFLRSDSDKADLDWKLRARTNAERMATGGIIGLAEVVKGLQVLSELRPLPAKERELYDNARHLLVAEISASLTMAECDAEDAIDIVLFPPGKERPKRTAEEFRTITGEEGEEALDLGEDLLAMGGDLDLPSEPEEQPEEQPPEEAAEEPAAEAEEEAPKKRGRPPRAAAAEAAEEAPKKRGRPQKPKPEAAQAEPAAPKKRGRPPKPKPQAAEAAAPKKRGRPPKARSEAEAKKPAAKAKKK